MIEPSTDIYIYSLLHGNMPDIFTALQRSLYHFTNSSSSPHPTYLSLTLFSY